ncbi:MAG: hypothetical protein OHK0039_08610 [Bacteroidia bacterium]
MRILTLCALLLAACGTAPQQTADQTTASESAAAGLRPQTFERSRLLPDMRFLGELVDGQMWEDDGGFNAVILSQEVVDIENPDFQQEITLHAYHYRVQDGQLALLREVVDFEKDCPFDNMARFAPRSLRLHDLDTDGLGEVSFVYYLGCVSDVSPTPMKLLTLENGDKYIIRGNTIAALSETEQIGGEQQIDASFQQGPPALLAHAQILWQEFVAAQYEE